MAETVRLNITQKDISKGIPKCGSQCPIAIAFTRLYGGPDQVSWVAISEKHSTICFTDGIQLQLDNNRAAQQFINTYDSGPEIVQPTVLTFRECP